MGLNRRALGIGAILMFFTGMMPFSAMVVLSIMETEVLVLGIHEILFYLGWFINPVLMIIAGVLVMRSSASREYSQGLLAGVVLALVYTAVIMFMQVNFTPQSPLLLPFSGIKMPETYLGSFYELIIKAYVFCILGGIIGAYSVRRSAPGRAEPSETL